ncbi:MAG: ATP/GTP-binding protein [Thermoprotei archaeon]
MLGTIFFIGTAGSGKTWLVKAYYEYLTDQGLSASTLNLDPAVVALPYNPDVDVRNHVSMDKLLLDHVLGPNGAIVAAMDILASNLKPIIDELREADADYLLVDTPGQLELFAFREIGPLLLDSIPEVNKAAVFLLDPAIAQEPRGLASLLLLSASSSLRLGIPTINVVSKADAIGQNELERIMGYLEYPEDFVGVLSRGRSLVNTLSARLVEDVFEVASPSHPIPVSSKEFTGLEELHAEVQRIFLGGEVEDPGSSATDD